jgi:hypothetical protein
MYRTSAGFNLGPFRATLGGLLEPKPESMRPSRVPMPPFCGFVFSAGPPLWLRGCGMASGLGLLPWVPCRARRTAIDSTRVIERIDEFYRALDPFGSCEAADEFRLLYEEVMAQRPPVR